MTAELYALTLAGLLQAIHMMAFAIRANSEISPRYLMGPRDDAPRQALSTITGRMQRAFNNGFEALIWFTIAALVIVVSEQSTTWTALLAWVFLAARLAYIPAYILGWNPGRTIIWLVGYGAIVLMYLAALL